MKLIFNIHIYEVHPAAKRSENFYIPHILNPDKFIMSSLYVNHIAFLDKINANSYKEDTNPIWVEFKQKRL